jgi:hypothetical protein
MKGDPTNHLSAPEEARRKRREGERKGGGLLPHWLEGVVDLEGVAVKRAPQDLLVHGPNGFEGEVWMGELDEAEEPGGLGALVPNHLQV